MRKIFLFAAVIGLMAGCAFLTRQPDERLSEPGMPGEVEPGAPVPAVPEDPLSVSPGAVREADPPLHIETAPHVYNVFIRAGEFVPAVLRIGKGGEVSWLNMDDSLHAVAFRRNEGLGSTPLGRGESYSRVFDEAGVYDYYCPVHPGMTGTVIVEEKTD